MTHKHEYPYFIPAQKTSGQFSGFQVASTFLRKLTELMEIHFNNERFGVFELSNCLCLCPMQVHRKVKKLTGFSPGQYLLHFRLFKALQLLHKTDLNMGEIAYQTGFGSQNYFSRAFRKVHGITPRQARATGYNCAKEC